MFGFSRRRMKLGRLKVQLSDSTQGTGSPIRHPKRTNNISNGEGIAPAVINSDELKCQECSSTEPELNNHAQGNGENWLPLSIIGEKPTPRFNHAAAVIGNKMVVVGGESGNGLLEDVQVLNFDRFSWTTSSSKLYLSPTRLPLKVPACKGHSLISWGKKVLLIGGKTDPATDRISVWAFDTETECWSLLEAKGDVRDVPVARSGHTVVSGTTALILFGGEDSKRRKLNDLHMFDLKSFTWVPLQSTTGSGPSARSNHVAALYDDKLLFIFGGTSKSRTLNDLYSLDFETMVWSRIKTRGFHPLPRGGSCGVLCGTKWYIAGGGSRKKRHAETLIFDVIKHEWSLAVASPSSSITNNKGFSLVLVQQKERDLLVAFGGTKKEPSNQVEVLSMEKNELSVGRRSTLSMLSENSPSAAPTKKISNGTLNSTVDSVGRQNVASSVAEKHGSGRRSLSESLLVDPGPGNISLRKQLHNEEENNCLGMKAVKSLEDEKSSQVMDQTRKQFDIGIQSNTGRHKEETPLFEPENSDKEGKANLQEDGEDFGLLQENDAKSSSSELFSVPSSLYRVYETKVASLIKKNGILEGQLAAASASREAAEKNLANVLKSRQEMERKLGDTLKEMEFLREKLVAEELAKEEANSLSNIVHSDNVRLEHDVAFLKAVLDDTQKELHSTRGVLAGERARAFQLQVEVFHLKQRMQSMENQAPTPRKPFHV